MIIAIMLYNQMFNKYCIVGRFDILQKTDNTTLPKAIIIFIIIYHCTLYNFKAYNLFFEDEFPHGASFLCAESLLFYICNCIL